MENFYKIMELSPQEAISESLKNCYQFTSPPQKMLFKYQSVEKQVSSLASPRHPKKKSLKKCFSSKQIKNDVLEEIPIKITSQREVNPKGKENNGFKNQMRNQIKYNYYQVKSPKMSQIIKIPPKVPEILSPRLNIVYVSRKSMENSQENKFNQKKSMINKISPKSTFCSNSEQETQQRKSPSLMIRENEVKIGSERNYENAEEADQKSHRFNSQKLEYKPTLADLNPKLTQSQVQHSQIFEDEVSEVIERHMYSEHFLKAKIFD